MATKKHDYTVPVPDAKGRIIYKKKGDATYVLYQYAQDYRPEKKVRRAEARPRR